jgi:hypothetical protein
MEITLEEIQKKFESLPENLKWAIMAANVDDSIIAIGNEQNLNVEQMGQLSLETHMEMFGFTPPEKFEDSIKKSLGFPDEKTHAIAEAVNDKIFKEIREKIGESANVSTPEESEEDSDKVLNTAGIQIINDDVNKNLPTPEKLEITGGKIVPPPAPSMMAQKLSAPVQTATVKTEHSLENITKTATPTTYPKNGDPYRLPPE